MGFSEIEKTEQKLPMNSVAAENGGCWGITSNESSKQARGILSPKLSRSLYGLSNNEKRNLAFIVICSVSLVFIVSLISMYFSIRSSSSSSSTTLLGRSEVLPTAQLSPSTPTECCPDGWIGYQRKCYYFSDSDRNWTYSQNYCASFNASLAVIDSQEEMRFLRRYKGPADHWIGLQRNDDQEPWRWIDGTIFNFWFEIRGGGKFAYINHQGVAGSSGRREEPWICSKQVHKSYEIYTEPQPESWLLHVGPTEVSASSSSKAAPHTVHCNDPFWKLSEHGVQWPSHHRPKGLTASLPRADCLSTFWT